MECNNLPIKFKLAPDIKNKYHLSTVARSVQKIREFIEQQKVNLSQDFLDLHELMRAREEVAILEVMFITLFVN